MSKDISDYNFVLQGRKSGWVLLRSPELQAGYCVFNELNSTLLLIESEEENTAVCECMRELGAEVLESLPINSGINVSAVYELGPTRID